MELNLVYLLLGSNIGDRFAHMQNGIRKIDAQAGMIQKQSSFYETEPWGVINQANYLNAAVLIKTPYTPAELFYRLKSIEADEGRTDQTKYASRTLDIDILFYNNLILRTPQLKIPHPKLSSRQFVLEPLNEIAPAFMHPEFNKTISQLLMECTDDKKVNLL
jgi:2-amino-4-hydroxy-6-hydroxymethyldihydropteridine diphosphokinase